MIKTKNDYKYYLQSDIIAKFNNNTDWKFYYKHKYPELHFQRLLRKVEYLSNYKSCVIGKIYYYIYLLKFKKRSEILGLSIPLNVTGPGLAIVHSGSIIINHNTRIGKNCRIHSAVNIGGNVKIGNNVYIGPGAKIFGDIEIGDNVSIGANAVVNRSVPPNVTIGGIPAKIIKYEGSENLINDVQSFFNEN